MEYAEIPEVALVTPFPYASSCRLNNISVHDHTNESCFEATRFENCRGVMYVLCQAIHFLIAKLETKDLKRYPNILVCSLGCRTSSLSLTTVVLYVNKREAAGWYTQPISQGSSHEPQ